MWTRYGMKYCTRYRTKIFRTRISLALGVGLAPQVVLPRSRNPRYMCRWRRAVTVVTSRERPHSFANPVARHRPPYCLRCSRTSFLASSVSVISCTVHSRGRKKYTTIATNISRNDSMKKTKDVSDEDEYSADDPEEVGGASEEEWTPEAGAEGGTKIRPQREATKKRQHSDEEEEEEEEEEGESDDDEEDEDTDSDTGKKPKKKRRPKKEDDEEEEDSDSFNESSGETPKDYTSGAFVVAKADVSGTTDPTLWRIDGKALLQKFLPFKEDGKTLYKSTSTYSGWSVNNKDNYLAAQVTFKVQSRAETIVELHLDQQQEVKEEKED